jgi:diadenylate cyclase
VIPFDRFSELLDRLAAYPPWEVAIELLLIGLVVWAVVRFAQGTRAAGALKGIFLIVVLATVTARVVGGGEAFQRLAFLYDRFLAIVAVGLLVIFQPELRRALIRLGETPFFRSSPTDIADAVDAIVEACAYFSKSRFGAIIAIEREINLRGVIEGGTRLGAELSSRLLQTIFFPGAALHDLAVVVKGNVIHAAGVQFPLADPTDMPDPRLGSRHRAAVGLTKEADALVVVVSEETGEIRIAERGRLSEPMDADGLREQLTLRLRLQPPAPDPQTAEEAATEEHLSQAGPTEEERAREAAQREPKEPAA